MDLRIFTEPQFGATYGDQLAVAQAAEAGGFDAFFRSDHWQTFGGDGRPGPTDSWVTLGAIARETERIRLGTLVTSATFRFPGPLAVAVAQIDEMSGGRVELGIGAGWFDGEHDAYGIPFPATGERFDRLEEQLAVITGLWGTPVGETFSFDGQHYPVKNSPALPKPVQSPGPPVIIGGHGPKRTPRLAATYADEFNFPFSPIPDFTAQVERVTAACEARERDPSTMTWSTALTAVMGADEAEFQRRAEAIGQDPEGLRTGQLGGTPDQIRDRLGQWADAGTQRVYLQVLDLRDLDHIALLSEELVGKV
jgi:F420-dependent oxidoreductase-like protein